MTATRGASETRRFVALGTWDEATVSPAAMPLMLSDAGPDGAVIEP